jgi:heterodisulfide reductase subunit B
MEKVLEKEEKNAGGTREALKVAYYPGCSLNSTAIDFNTSIKKLYGTLGVELEEIEDWNCCGTTPAQNISRELVSELSARNVRLAGKMGFSEILSPCISCYCKLFKAASGMKKAGEGDFKIFSIVEHLLFLKDIIAEKYAENRGRIKPFEENILNNLKPVCYYGCVLLRTENIYRFDSFENPTSMEKVLEAAGVNALNFSFKTECCGAILSLTHKEIVLKLSRKILDVAIEAGANSIITCCPLCQQNLDMRQSQINRYFKTNYKIPVFYISQILGLALGIPFRELMINKLFVKPDF